MERKLAAIFSTDVKGYSRLMGDDEEATIQTLKTYREVITTLIEQHHGRVVDSPGDNLPAEFASAVDAVKSAVAIQRELKTRNTELEAHRKMEFRIGLNVGDVIADEERLYGDGVNIAARLEGLAAPGGICISGTVHEYVENKLDLTFSYQGEKTVKNIAKPVRVYKVRLATEQAASLPSLDSLAELPLPDKPSIAVLPFTNMSNDPEQEYFSDGMTDDIITDLSKISGLFVIARNSTFTYKGQAVKVAEVGRELGVRHVLEGSVRKARRPGAMCGRSVMTGSVRKAGNRVRINVQLIDAPTGGHVWAERYDRELEDIFALQDEITQKIVFALKVTLSPQEQARFLQAPTTSLEAYDSFLRGLEAFYRFTKDDLLHARQLFTQATELDSNYAAAFARLGQTYGMALIFQWSQEAQAVERGLALAQKALVLDSTLPDIHKVLGGLYMHQRQYEQATAEMEQAIALAPNDAEGYWLFAMVLNFACRPAEAIARAKQGLRLDPHEPLWSLFQLGFGSYAARQYEGALDALQRVLVLNPDLLPAHRALAATYCELGRQVEARAEVAEMRRLNPEISIDAMRQGGLPFKDPAFLDRYLTALRNAGLE